MTVLLACATTFASLIVLSTIASERARAYGLGLSFLRWSAISIAIVAVVTAAALALRRGAETTDPLLLATCAVVAVTDTQTGYIFDRVLLFSSVALLAAIVLTPHSALDALAGAAASGGALLVPYVATNARGLGFGDVKFAMVAGMGLGAARAIAAVWLACVLAGAFGAVLLSMRRAGRGTELRFGPFIALGACCALLVR